MSICSGSGMGPPPLPAHAERPPTMRCPVCKQAVTVSWLQVREDTPQHWSFDDHEPSVERCRPVTQTWTHALPLMQQTVLLTAVRGPDGLPKYHPVKYLLRWYRRCVLLSALDRRVLTDPVDVNGGSFTGRNVVNGSVPWEPQMDEVVSKYLESLDVMPLHFHLHLVHAVEILGYKHPDERIRAWWGGVYERLVHDLHLWPETEEQLDRRLGDTREGWLERADEATRA